MYFTDEECLKEAAALQDQAPAAQMETDVLDEIQSQVALVVSGDDQVTDSAARDIAYRSFLAGRASLRNEVPREGVHYVPMTSEVMANLLTMLLEQR